MRLGGASGSVYGVQSLQLPRLLQQVQAALGKLQEVGSIAMAFQRLLVHILLVEHHRRGVTLHKVGDVVDAALLLARRQGELAQRFGDDAVISLLEPHPHGKADHPRITFLRLYAFSASSNAGRVMVCPRSGPVDTMPMVAPDSRSRKFRYSCASFGSLSNSVIPSVDVFQPFSLV